MMIKQDPSRRRRFLRGLLLDVAVTCAALVVFALFHHVLPRQGQSLGIEIPRPAAAEETVKTETVKEENAVTETANEEKANKETGNKETTNKETANEGTAGTRRSHSRTASAGRGGQPGRKNSRTVSGEKGGSALTGDSAAQTATDTDETPADAAEALAGAAVTGTDAYTGDGVSVTVSEVTLAGGSVTCHIADIRVDDVTSLRTALAGGTYGTGYRAEIADMAADGGALLAVNGDYYGNTTEGVVIRNGVLYRANPTDCDVCVLYYDGTMRVMAGADFDAEAAVADGAWQAWTFGPALLDADGHALTAFSSTRRLAAANPRTAIGYYGPGHYCLVVVDGRGDSAGLSLADLSALFEDLGCRAAYNLDGGNSSVMVWQGQVINDPSGGGRASSDALMVVEVKE